MQAIVQELSQWPCYYPFQYYCIDFANVTQDRQKITYLILITMVQMKKLGEEKTVAFRDLRVNRLNNVWQDICISVVTLLLQTSCFIYFVVNWLIVLLKVFNELAKGFYCSLFDVLCDIIAFMNDRFCKPVMGLVIKTAIILLRFAFKYITCKHFAYLKNIKMRWMCCRSVCQNQI